MQINLNLLPIKLENEKHKRGTTKKHKIDQIEEYQSTSMFRF